MLCGAIIIIAYIILKRKCNKCDTCDSNDSKTGKKEGYGGGQTKCEEACFSSQYYDACMNSCLQHGHADYMETGNEYDVLGVAQVDDLDRGFGYDTPQEQYGLNPIDQRFGLRGETPGR